MSTVPPSNATNAPGNATRTGPWKAPSGQLHGTQAQFAALLFQAEDTAEAEGSASVLTALKNTATDGSLPQDLDTASATFQDDEANAVPTAPAHGSATPPPDWLLAWAAGGFHALPGPDTTQAPAMTGSWTGTTALPPGAERGSADLTRFSRGAAPNGEPGAMAFPSGLGQGNPGVMDAGLLKGLTAGAVPTPAGPYGQPTLVTSNARAEEAKNSSFIASSAESKSAEGLFDSQFSNPTTASTSPGASRVRLNAWRGTLAGGPTVGMTTPSTVRLASGHAQGGPSAGATWLGTPTPPGAPTGLAGWNGDATPTGRRGEAAPTGLTQTDEPEGSSLTGDTPELPAAGATEHRQSTSEGQSGGASDASIDWGAPAEGVNAQAPAEAGTESAFQSQVDELVQQMEQWFAQGTQSASLTVDAGGERPVDIEVTLNRGRVSVRFDADETGTQEALLGSVEAALKPLLAQHGLSLQEVQVAPHPNPGAFAGQGGSPDPSTQGRQGDPGLSTSGGRGHGDRDGSGLSGLDGQGPSASTAPVRRSRGTVDLFA